MSQYFIVSPASPVTPQRTHITVPHDDTTFQIHTLVSSLVPVARINSPHTDEKRQAHLHSSDTGNVSSPSSSAVPWSFTEKKHKQIHVKKAGGNIRTTRVIACVERHCSVRKGYTIPHWLYAYARLLLRWWSTVFLHKQMPYAHTSASSPMLVVEWGLGGAVVESENPVSLPVPVAISSRERLMRSST